MIPLRNIHRLIDTDSKRAHLNRWAYTITVRNHWVETLAKATRTVHKDGTMSFVWRTCNVTQAMHGTHSMTAYAGINYANLQAARDIRVEDYLGRTILFLSGDEDIAQSIWVGFQPTAVTGLRVIQGREPGTPWKTLTKPVDTKTARRLVTLYNREAIVSRFRSIPYKGFQHADTA